MSPEPLLRTGLCLLCITIREELEQRGTKTRHQAEALSGMGFQEVGHGSQPFVAASKASWVLIPRRFRFMVVLSIRSTLTLVPVFSRE